MIWILWLSLAVRELGCRECACAVKEVFKLIHTYNINCCGLFEALKIIRVLYSNGLKVIN